MSDKPHRVQLSRKKGWRMPPNTVRVARPGKWGNPFAVGKPYETVGAHTRYVATQVDAVRLFCPLAYARKPEIVAELRGKNLACWCALDEPCHADVLLRIANA